MSKIDIENIIDKDTSPALQDSYLGRNINESIKIREELLNTFIDLNINNYKSRWKVKKIYQHLITIILLLVVIMFAVFNAIVLFKALNGDITDIGVLVTIVSSITASFLSSIFSMLLIIVKYIFPKREEENSMDVLKTTFQYNYRYINQQIKNSEKSNSQN